MAPWVLMCGALRWEPPVETARREVVRVTAPSPTRMRSLVGAPRAADCDPIGEIDRDEGDRSVHSHGMYVRSAWRCGIAPLESVFRSHGGDLGSSNHSSWFSGDWRCTSEGMSYSERSYHVVRELRMRRSRDGRFMEFTCVMTRCDSQRGDACSDPFVISNPGPLYVGEVPVLLRELVRREGPSPLHHPEALAAIFAVAAALALFWIARNTPRSTAAGMTSAYRDMPQADLANSTSAEHRLRRALIAVTAVFGAMALASWFAVARALTR